MNKPRDYGYKWRTLKNATRFFKNPVGFISWRYAYRAKQNRAFNIYYISVGAVIFGFSFLTAIENRGKLIINILNRKKGKKQKL